MSERDHVSHIENHSSASFRPDFVGKVHRFIFRTSKPSVQIKVGESTCDIVEQHFTFLSGSAMP